ncbi:MAG: ABC transporter substrate-binding protein [Pseudoxanthomonas sp.]
MPSPPKILAFLLLAAALAACSRAPSSASAQADVAPARPSAGGSLTWGVETEPQTLNPHINGQDKVALILRNSYESLLARTEDGGFVARLASAWEVSDDGLTYTFHLRPDVKFSDGSALDAATVIRNVQALRQPGYTPIAIHIFYLDRIADIQAPDPHTLRITLKQPYSPFLGYFSSLPLLASSAFDSPDLKAGGPGIAGTGPFVIKRYQPGQQIEFEK